MIVLSCPNCSATLELDENRQFAFCQYCGTKITNISNCFELDRKTEINNLISRALEFERRADYKRCMEYCNRVLDLDPDNAQARELERRLPCSEPNVTVVYRSSLDERYKLRVTLDGRNWKVLSKNETLSLTLSAGRHKIIFSGTKTYTKELSIVNPHQKTVIIYEAQRFQNTIELSNL